MEIAEPVQRQKQTAERDHRHSAQCERTGRFAQSEQKCHAGDHQHRQGAAERIDEGNVAAAVSVGETEDIHHFRKNAQAEQTPESARKSGAVDAGMQKESQPDQRTG